MYTRQFLVFLSLSFFILGFSGCGYEPPHQGAEGGKCLPEGCFAGLECAGGYCVPEAGTQVNGDTSVDDAASVGDAALVDILSLTPEVSTNAYTSGGLLASYYADLPTSFNSLGTPTFLRVEEDLNLTKNESDIGTINDGNPFAVVFEGGLHILESGVYRLGVTAADSVRLTLGGAELVKFWKAGTLVHSAKEIELEAGWYPLELIYVRSIFQAHLQLWVEKVGGDVKPASAEVLGYETVLPDDAPDLLIDHVLGEATYYAATLDIDANLPVQVDVLAVDGTSLFSVEEFISTHDIHLPLMPGISQSVSVLLRDMWGREDLRPLGNLVPPALPEFELGGLLGAYYAGTEFEELRGERVDTNINFPFNSGGDGEQGFGLGTPADNFSVRWTGGVFIEEAGEYAFYVGTDDGRRAWLDGVLVADAWYAQAISYSQVSVSLVAGWHPLIIEMYDSGGAAAAYLEWTGPGISRSFVPAEVLGYTLPASDAKLPQFQEFQWWFGPLSTTGNITFRTSELVRSAFKITTKGTVTVETHDTPSTSFQYTALNLPDGNNCEDGVFCGPIANVEVTLTDLEGNKSVIEHVNLSIPAPETGSFYKETFNGEALDPAWVTVTQGKNDSTPNWELSDGAITENGNANGTVGSDEYGTFLLNSDWQYGNGKLSAHLFASDNDSFGFMYAVQPGGIADDLTTWSYYRIDLDTEGVSQAVRVTNGNFTVLLEDADYKPPRNQWFLFELEREDGVHTISIDGVDIFKYADVTYGTGAVAIYASAMQGYSVNWVAIHTEL